jgi:hypothetical protein
LYPPSSNDNFINEVQQKNAVPPLAPAAAAYWQKDIEKWQAELGNASLYDQINTFPINMVGHDDDLMLRLNGENCPRFGQALKDYSAYLDELTAKY